MHMTTAQGTRFQRGDCVSTEPGSTGGKRSRRSKLMGDGPFRKSLRDSAAMLPSKRIGQGRQVEKQGRCGRTYSGTPLGIQKLLCLHPLAWYNGGCLRCIGARLCSLGERVLSKAVPTLALGSYPPTHPIWGNALVAIGGFAEQVRQGDAVLLQLARRLCFCSCFLLPCWFTRRLRIGVTKGVLQRFECGARPPTARIRTNFGRFRSKFG